MLHNARAPPVPHAVRAEVCHKRREQHKQRHATPGDHNGLPPCNDALTPGSTNCLHDLVIIGIIHFTMQIYIPSLFAREAKYQVQRSEARGWPGFRFCSLRFRVASFPQKPKKAELYFTYTIFTNFKYVNRKDVDYP